jgi:hypothetical protein
MRRMSTNSCRRRRQVSDHSGKIARRPQGGAECRHTTETLLEIDPFFNFAAVERRPGSDRLFLKMTPPQGGK